MKSKVRSNYLDLGQLERYWAPALQPHTAPTSMVYGLRERLRALQAEGSRLVSPAIACTAMRSGAAPWT